ncbi:TIGR01777 family oxidoreductase [Corynebacterium pseudotuberculosis]|uniref:TIGR01777 family protein n=1 Tax=Corynebacterium pseudotuberculosis (strain C231) TaxID=681645 RepID=D9QAN2_CORP2|nr:TIGR01777 family oxidoreductase [Corynebacterium pseudotuberculosis]ADK28929.1 TIGR01777 family protein [Corynebacterium pseudotuberculosis FRC41]ADL10608.1 TIGR01777 family protein [Corynebacterium pseudotuberculosis C231]ADL21018.1 TIGR01777 family protein [Corynebacterium pseudotuberculosis 1002]ADO26407.1 TIGR01777 family protein [Corynebacterium pseudotuberculosis I19]AEK92469.1 Epimerase family protein yfcH [Corynebacterium pseudotuberculosis PAT10]
MSFSTTHVVPASRNDVWTWHTRPGSIVRLTPPFFPMTPTHETPDLAAGSTVFSLPAGLRWEARHDLSGYVKGYRFTDVCVTSPVKALANWRHVHEFSDHVDGTAITDTVYTRAPKSMLTPSFAYRQQQLIHDIAAGQRFAEIQRRSLGTTAPLTVAMTGSRGLIGKALRAQLTSLGHTVIPLVRSRASEGERLWDPSNPSSSLLEGVDALVHLAGEPIAGRFTDSHKKAIRDSRVEPSQRLAALIAKSPTCHTLVQASAVGFYGAQREEEILGEDASAGSGFLADVVKDWELASSSVAEAGKRAVYLRTGATLSGRGGILPVLKTLFSVGLGGSFEGGAPWFSWISIDDLCDLYVRALVDPSMSGPINAVAPNPIRNQDFAKALGTQLKRPSKFPIPSIGPKLILGTQGAEEVAFANQRVSPSALLKLGHTFRYLHVDSCLAHELGGEHLADAPDAGAK